MKPATDSEAQAVLDAVAAGDPIPSGYAFDGTTVFVVEDTDLDRIEDGGPVEPPPDPTALNPAPVADAPADEEDDEVP